jgi:hypothetical protein
MIVRAGDGGIGGCIDDTSEPFSLCAGLGFHQALPFHEAVCFERA